MKTKIYLADCNAIIAEKFNADVDYVYPNAHKESDKEGAYYAWITNEADFIAVGTNEEYRSFDNWNDAAAYANTISGKYSIGIRKSGHMKYEVIATAENFGKVRINNMINLINEHYEDRSGNGFFVYNHQEKGSVDYINFKSDNNYIIFIHKDSENGKWLVNVASPKNNMYLLRGAEIGSRWSKSIVERAARMIINAIDEYEEETNKETSTTATNGFETDEQYIQVIDALIDNCPNAETIMANYNPNTGVIDIYLDDCRYFADSTDGVFCIHTSDNAMSKNDIANYHDLLNCIDGIFDIIEYETDTDDDENEAFTAAEVAEHEDTGEKWTEMTFAIASRIAKHFNDINLMDGLDICFDEGDNTLWVNNYQLFRNGNIRYWGDEESEWPELAEYLSKQPSYWFDFVNAYYSDERL